MRTEQGEIAPVPAQEQEKVVLEQGDSEDGGRGLSQGAAEGFQAAPTAKTGGIMGFDEWKSCA